MHAVGDESFLWGIEPKDALHDSSPVEIGTQPQQTRMRSASEYDISREMVLNRHLGIVRNDQRLSKKIDQAGVGNVYEVTVNHDNTTRAKSVSVSF